MFIFTISYIKLFSAFKILKSLLIIILCNCLVIRLGLNIKKKLYLSFVYLKILLASISAFNLSYHCYKLIFVSLYYYINLAITISTSIF